MTQMTIPAFRVSVNPALRLARLRCLARPAGRGAAGRAVAVPGRHRAGRWFLDALGRPVAVDLGVDSGAGGARIVAVIIIIATGLALAFGDLRRAAFAS